MERTKFSCNLGGWYDDNPLSTERAEEISRRLQRLSLDHSRKTTTRQPADGYRTHGKRVCLVVCDKSREGYQHDINYVNSFCLLHGFDYYETELLSKKGLIDSLESFKSMYLHGDVCALAIFIMAHGSVGHIKASDGKIKLHRIFEMFNNRGCPALRGKPKLFVIQACQIDKKDSYHPYCDASEPSRERQDRLWPEESDCFYVYAVCPGRVAICYPDRGSPLFEEMDNVISNGSYQTMEDFFTRVNQRLMERQPVDEAIIHVTHSWMNTQNFVMPGAQKTRKPKAPVGGPLHVINSLVKKWYLL